jgi:hypothetical protein
MSELSRDEIASIRLWCKAWPHKRDMCVLWWDRGTSCDMCESIFKRVKEHRQDKDWVCPWEVYTTDYVLFRFKQVLRDNGEDV